MRRKGVLSLLSVVMVAVMMTYVYSRPLKARAEVIEHEVVLADGDTVWSAEGLVARAFAKLPLNGMEILTESMRLDMLDFWAMDSVYCVHNAMEGVSYLEELTDDYLKAQVTPVSTLQLKLLAGKKSEKLVMCIYTIGDSIQAPDSRVTFYKIENKDVKDLDDNLKLIELPVDKYLRAPGLLDFFDTRDKKVKKMITEAVPFPTIEYMVSPESDNLSARLTIEKFMGREQYDSIKPYMRKQVVLKWNGRFEVSK